MIASAQAKTEAEQAIIGSAMIDPRCVGEILGRLEPEDFGETLRPFYFALRQLFRASQAIDPVTVTNLLGDSYRKTAFELMEATPTAANCKSYIAQLIRQNRLLRVQELARQFADLGDSEALPELLTAIGDASGEPDHVAQYTSQQRMVRFMERQTGPKIQYLRWGIEKLDATVRAEPGDFIILGAEPSAGKTALAIQLADHQSSKERVGFYSLETSEAKITDRQLAMRHKIPLGDIKGQGIPEERWVDIINDTPSFDAGRSFDVIEAHGWSAQQIESHAVSHGYKIIYIDYLQLMRAYRGETEYSAVTRTSKELHTMAQRRKITVVALSQFSRPSGDTKDPDMHCLRSSGQIEQDADAILLLFCSTRDRSDPKTRRLKIAKNKEGASGKQIPLLFDGRIQRFSINWEVWRRNQNAHTPPPSAPAPELTELPPETQTPWTAEDGEQLTL